MLRLLYDLQIKAACFSSLHARDAGGVVTLLPQMTQAEADEAVRDERIRVSELVPGRVLRAAIKARADDERPDAMLVVYNVHNFGLTAQQVSSISSRISAEAEQAALQPHKMTLIAMGDLNYTEAAPMHLHVPEIDKGLIIPPRHRGRADLWAAAMSEMTELDPEAPTHDIHDDQRLSQLDKVMISTPGWLLLQW
eukprot:4569174-Pyramimonas_sp.AAC.2